jgi:Outer membrane protein beta-barrel domain
MERVPDSAGSSVTDSLFSLSGYSNCRSILANRPTFGTGINGSIHGRARELTIEYAEALFTRVSKLKLTTFLILAIALAPLSPLHAQDDCSGVCKVNTNLAMVANVPVSSTAHVTGVGWGVVGGIGYNFNQRNAVIGEFLWNRMYPSGGVLQQFQTGPSESSSLKGNSNLYALSGNYRYEMRGRLLGAYLIGGGGWYFRKNWLSRDITAGPGTACTPAWQWWGFTCTSGTVTASQTLATSSTNAWGANAGIGFTVRVGEGPYRLYTETRYYYAPTKNVNTQFIAVSVGIRY